MKKHQFLFLMVAVLIYNSYLSAQQPKDIEHAIAAIEKDVRIRFASNVRLANGVYLDQGVYLHAVDAETGKVQKTFLFPRKMIPEKNSHHINK